MIALRARLIGLVALLAAIIWTLTPAVPVSAQTFTAQIQQFYNQLRTGALTFVTLATQVNGYHNFSTPLGAAGYGIRDLAGTLQYKNSGGGWVSLPTAGSAPSDATYITQTASAGLSAEQALAALSSGVLAVTTTTGVVASVANVAAGSYLRSAGTGNTAPIWSTLILPNSATTGDLLSATSANTVGNIAAVAVGQLLTSTGTSTLPAWSAAPTLTTSLTVNRASTGTSVLVGLSLVASTDASLGAQQDAPWANLIAKGWNNTANASHPVEFGWRNRPTQGNPVTSTLTLFQQINNGGYSTVASWTNAGAFTANTSVTAGSTVSATTTSNFGTNLLSNAAIAYNGSSVVITSGISTTTPSIVGKASSFAVTVAATPGITGLITFGTAFSQIPSCSATNTITANFVQTVPTTTNVVFDGIWQANDIIRVICLGW